MENFTLLLKKYADFAMYLAKSSRKGDLFSFDRQSYEEKSFIVNNKEDLNRLLEEGLVEYHFQPIVDCQSGELTGVEALARWHHPEQGFIPPGQFIPIGKSDPMNPAAIVQNRSDLAKNHLQPVLRINHLLRGTSIKRAIRLGTGALYGWSFAAVQ